MALIFDDIRKTVIDSIKAAIGDQLSQTFNPVLNITYGTVLNARPNPEKAIPDYPYAVLDITSSADTDWFLTALKYDKATDQFQYVTTKTLNMQISIYGDDAIQIAENLKTSYRRDDILNILKNGGLGVGDVQLVQILPELLQTDFLEVGFVLLTIRVNDIFSDPDLGSIENVILDGELVGTISGEPLLIHVDTTEE